LITPSFESEDFYISERPDSNPIQRPSWGLSPKHHHWHNFQVVMVHSSTTSNRRNPTQGFQIQLEGYSRTPQQVIPNRWFWYNSFRKKNNISFAGSNEWELIQPLLLLLWEILPARSCDVAPTFFDTKHRDEEDRRFLELEAPSRLPIASETGSSTSQRTCHWAVAMDDGTGSHKIMKFLRNEIKPDGMKERKERMNELATRHYPSRALRNPNFSTSVQTVHCARTSSCGVWIQIVSGNVVDSQLR